MAEAHRPARPRSERGVFDPEPWRSELRGFAVRMGAGQDAEDVVQETFLRALRTRPAGRPRAWLHQVALNVLRDRARRLRPAAEDDVAELEAETPDPGALASARDASRIAWRAVGRLPDRQRAALVLRLRKHMEYEEIAVVLDCSVGAARQHFHLAIRKVRDVLAEDDDG